MKHIFFITKNKLPVLSNTFYKINSFNNICKHYDISYLCDFFCTVPEDLSLYFKLKKNINLSIKNDSLYFNNYTIFTAHIIGLINYDDMNILFNNRNYNITYYHKYIFFYGYNKDNIINFCHYINNNFNLNANIEFLY